jgi:RHS repeat-associated protein
VLDLGVTTSYGANSVNAYHSISGSAAPVHDDNGNMTSGPVNGSAASGMVFGKENNNLLQAVSGHTSDYVYDAMGRLVQLTRHDVGAGQTATEILTWAGWTLMTREIFTGNAVTETFRYTWGTDLSGTLEGAGGVGGMLAVERNVAGSNTWDIRYTHADANGNIIALTDNSGNVSARYRYDAFGKVLSATDVDASGWVNHNIHGFSSKPSFGNQGLLYYGYRWYSPSLGRWINRDPIEESGGMNLYGFVSNDGVGHWDVLGLDWHHRIPKAERLREWLEKAGMCWEEYIHSPANGLMLKQTDHAELHGRWNFDWYDFMDDNPDATLDQIHEQLGKMESDPQYKDIIETGEKAEVDYKKYKQRQKKINKLKIRGLTLTVIGGAVALANTDKESVDAFLETAENYQLHGEFQDYVDLVVMANEMGGTLGVVITLTELEQK